MSRGKAERRVAELGAPHRAVHIGRNRWVDDGTDRLIDAGWWTDEDVSDTRDMLRELIPFEPRAGNRQDAAIVIVLARFDLIPQGDPHIQWAGNVLTSNPRG